MTDLLEPHLTESGNREKLHHKVELAGVTLVAKVPTPLVTAALDRHWRVRALREFYEIPLVKFVTRLVSHLCWLVVYCLLILENTTSDVLETALQPKPGETYGSVPTMLTIEFVWIFFQVGMFMDQRHQDTRQARRIRRRRRRRPRPRTRPGFKLGLG